MPLKRENSPIITIMTPAILFIKRSWRSLNFVLKILIEVLKINHQAIAPINTPARELIIIFQEEALSTFNPVKANSPSIRKIAPGFVIVIINAEIKSSKSFLPPLF